jgi:hypothetical protein
MATAPLCAFNEARDRFAVVTLDGRLKLWEVKGAALLHAYAADDHLSQRYTCIAWSSAALDGVGGGSKKQKKRKRDKSGGAERPLGLIALGAANGCITVWDLVRGETRCVLGGGKGGKGGHKGGVAHIVWSADGTTLYSCSTDDKRVLEWTVPAEGGGAAEDGPVEARKVCSWSGGASRLALRPAQQGGGGAVLAVASIKVGLFDAATGERQRTFGAGHSSDAHALAFSNSGGSASTKAGRFLVSACAGSNFINLYDCAGLPDASPKTAVSPTLVFSCEGNVSGGSLSLSCLPPLAPAAVDGGDGSDGDASLALCARTASGTLALWSVAVPGAAKAAAKPATGKPRAADGFAIVKEGGARKAARQVLCGAVGFSSGGDGATADWGSLSVDVVRGTEGQPVFDCCTISAGSSGSIHTADVELGPLERATLMPGGATGAVSADSLDTGAADTKAAAAAPGSCKKESKRAKRVEEATAELAARDAVGGVLVDAPTLAEREVRMAAVDGEGDKGGAAPADDEEAEAAASALTLGERAAALAERFDVTGAQAADRVAEDKEAASAAAAGSRHGLLVTALPRAGSLTSVLEQALQANDDALLEFVLRSVEPKVRRMRAAKRVLAVTTPDDITLMHHSKEFRILQCRRNLSPKR